MMARATHSDSTLRQATRYRGISYRQRANGSRTYSVYFKGRYISITGGEQDALAKQSELRSSSARGELPIASTRITFAEVAEQWYESKHRLRPYTRLNYRRTLDRLLIPRFGQMRINAITPEHVAALIRDLERQGLASTTVTDYCKPLAGTLTFALRRRLIAANPYLL